MSQPIKTFLCYSKEDREVVVGLKKHLEIFRKNGFLDIWWDEKILAGEDWDKVKRAELKRAQLILLFISVDFVNSDYIEKTELKFAFKRFISKDATIIPILVRYCIWKEYFDIGRFQTLPSDTQPIYSSHFPHLDEAYLKIAEKVQEAAQEIRDKQVAKIRAEKDAENILHKDKEAWKDAIHKGTIEAYESYAKGFSIHKPEAEELISHLKAGRVIIGHFVFDPKNQTVASKGGEPKTLSQKEAKLFKFLYEHPNQLLEYASILDYLGEKDDEQNLKNLRVAISNLRKSFGLAKKDLEAKQDKGYIFTPPS